MAAAPLNHVVVTSQEMFAALQAGDPFGYLDWLGVAAWSTLGNVVGGVVLVTGRRLVQVGVGHVDEKRDQSGKGSVSDRGRSHPGDGADAGTTD